MDKYVLTLEQLEQLLQECSWDLVGEYGTHAAVKDFIEENDIPTTAKLEYDAWSEGFDKARKTAFEALEQFKTK